MMGFMLTIFFIIAFYWFFQDIRRGKHRPPGPLRLPLLGNMVQIARASPMYSHIAFHKLSRIHGGIMRLKIGVKDVIVISNFHLMKDMLSKDVFCGRHFEGYMKERSFNKEMGVIFSSADQWKELRKFTVTNLRDFGFGKKETMESVITTEVRAFTRYLKLAVTQTNNLLLIDRLFHLSLLNILWSMVGGRTFAHDDPELLRLLKINEDVMRSGNFGANLAFAFPALTKFFPGLTGLTVQRRVNATFQQFVREIFKQHRHGNYDSSPGSFIDMCLREIDNSVYQKHSYFTEDQFVITTIDLFQVGSETTGNTLSYAILFMILHPEIQEKVHIEIVSQFPDGNLPCYDDRNLLPYTEATIREVLRMAEVVPVPPPRKATLDTSYKGYFIPKETIVTMNFYSVLMDKDFWGDPEKFRPERFIGTTQDVQRRKERVDAIFGFGKRICLGETLAKTSIFLYFTTLVRHFKFQKVPEMPLPSQRPLPGFILSPRPFYAVVEIRDRFTYKWQTVLSSTC